MKYETESDIETLVRSFEAGAIKRDDWRHAEHLTVALYYVWHHDFDRSLAKMRAGIFNLLRAFAVDLSKEMPYHETLTRFWLRAVEDFKNTKKAESIAAVCSQLIEKYDKDHPLAFYSRETLFSDRARAEFVEPDIRSIESFM